MLRDLLLRLRLIRNIQRIMRHQLEGDLQHPFFHFLQRMMIAGTILNFCLQGLLISRTIVQKLFPTFFNIFELFLNIVIFRPRSQHFAFLQQMIDIDSLAGNFFMSGFQPKRGSQIRKLRLDILNLYNSTLILFQ